MRKTKIRCLSAVLALSMCLSGIGMPVRAEDIHEEQLSEAAGEEAVNGIEEENQEVANYTEENESADEQYKHQETQEVQEAVIDGAEQITENETEIQEEQEYEAIEVRPETRALSEWQPACTCTGIIASSVVSFNPSGGTLGAGTLTSIYVCKVHPFIAPPNNPTRSGYRFVDWRSGNQSGSDIFGPWNFATGVAGAPVWLWARWQLTRTVTFNYNDGRYSNQTVDDNSLLTAPAIPSREHYDFGGWYKDAGCTVPWQFASDRVISDITVYAKWTPKTYWVTFNNQGGTGAGGVSAVYGNRINQPAAPTREHYNFGGWYKEAACVNPWNFASDTVTGSNITIYAKWTPKSYQVNYNSQGGSAVGSVSAPYGSTVSQPISPARTGYSFGGWYKEAACVNPWNFAADRVSVPVTTLYAKWTPNMYQITFNSQGGSSVGSQSVAYDSKITQPANPTRTGYTFGGWYREASCINQWNFSVNVVTGTATLYAKWTPIVYPVHFDSQGGSTVANQQIPYNGQVTLPVPPTRFGYMFAGWYQESSCLTPWNFTMNVIIRETTLYAKWEVKTYNVTFDSKGGTPGSIAGAANEGGLLTAPADPVRDDYVFAGWYKDEAYTQKWDFARDTVLSDMTLYAKWRNQWHDAVWDSQGGNEGIITQSGQYRDGQPISPGDIPTVTHPLGYRFAGWYQESQCINEWDFAQPIIDNVRLYAKWEVEEPEMLVEIPSNVELREWRDPGYASQTAEIKILGNSPDEAWFPDRSISVSTAPSFDIGLAGSSDTFQVDVFDGAGTAYDGTRPLMTLEPKGTEVEKSGRFTVKTPVDHGKAKGNYQGAMTFTIEFEGGTF